MQQVQPAIKKQQPLNSLMGKMTYLYKWDISEVIYDLVGLIKK